MKKLLLLIAFLSVTSGIFAQVSKTINLATAGTLSTSLTANELRTITNFTLTGTIDARDFKTMRDDMPVLAVLDLSGATIMGYNGPGGTSWGDQNYPANNIPRHAFVNPDTGLGKTSLISVVLPSSVTYIAAYAFQGCSGLTTVVIPSSVTSIGGYAFSYCHELTSVSIPSSVTSIEIFAFKGCTGLTNVNIPSSVTSIEYGAFGNSPCFISVDTDNPNYSSIDGVLYNKAQTTIIHCPISKIGSFNIPSSVTLIGEGAFFECTELTNFNIPSSVTSIGDKAFQGCIGLTNVNIPSSVTTIGSYAFAYIFGLTTITIPSSVTTIGSYAFTYIFGLKTITIPSSVTSIGEGAFWNCIGLRSITTSRITPIDLSSSYGVFAYIDPAFCTLYVPIGSKSAYQIADKWKDFHIVEKDMTGIESTISINLNTAGTLATSLTSNQLNTITNLTISGNIDARDFKTMRDNMPLLAVLYLREVIIKGYDGTGGTKPSWGDQNYPANIIPYYAFVNPETGLGKTSLISVVLPYSVTSIEYSAFKACSGLTTIVIPPPVTTIGNSAFVACSGLTTVVIHSTVTTIRDSAFVACSGLTTVTIPRSVTSIGNYAFSGCSGLTTVTIPSSVASIGYNTFDGCIGLTSIRTSRMPPIDLSSSENVFKDVNKTTCILYVPIGSKSAYQAADQWKDFANIVETIYTGIDPSISDQQLIVYPNPTTGKVKVVFDQIPQRGTILTVSDFTGKTILTQFIQNKEEGIDLSGNSPGVYLIQTNRKDFKVQKVILK